MAAMVSTTYAQKRKVLNLPTYDDNSFYHFGFILGANHMLFTVKTVDGMESIKWNSDQSPDIYGDSLYVYDIYSTPTPGFTVGILANLHLGRYADLRFIPALSFGERILKYNILRYQEGEPLFVEIDKSVVSTLIDFPLELRYKSRRLNNFRAYVLGGVQYTLDLANQKKGKGANSETFVKLNRNDLMFSVGTGVEFYTTYFKFGVEAKMSYGMLNVLNKENTIYTGSIDQLRSKIFLLSFTFE